MGKLNTFYGKKGEKGMSLLVFFVFFILGSALGMFMQTASLEEEFTGAAAAAAFLGRDWTGVMPSVGSISGFLRGIPYLPTMLCPDPVLQYKLFMLINSAAYAVIPLAAFRLSNRLGVEKLWQRLIITALCGIFPSVLIYSHYLLSEPLAAVFVMLLLLVIFRREKEGGKKAGLFFASVIAGLLTTGAYFLSPACIGIFIAVCLFCLYTKLTGGKKPVYFSAYAVTFIMLFAADIVLTYLARGMYDFSGGIVQSVQSSLGALADGGASLLTLIGGRLYYFIISTWGIGGAALTFVIIALVSFIRSKRKKEEQYYDGSFVSTGVLCTLMLIFTLSADAFLNVDGITAAQDTVFGAASVFNVAVPFVLLFFSYIFVYGISYSRLLLCVTGNGLAATAALLLYNASKAGTQILSNVMTPGITAMLIGCDASSGLTSSDMLYPVCLLFTVFAAAVPVVCCTKINASKITAFIFTGAVIYASIAAASSGLFGYAEESRENVSDTLRINECITAYSGGTGNKTIAVYDEDRMTAMSIQYYNQSSTVKYINEGQPVPKDCYLVSTDSVKTDGACVLIGRINDINVYAIGKNAIRQSEDELPERPEDNDLPESEQ
ncbi:MAG: hypothetical protein J6L61_05970 [Ruminiclostridium sp.]|nr:hypothetical protein [Ruminiclostridium sp.]